MNLIQRLFPSERLFCTRGTTEQEALRDAELCRSLCLRLVKKKTKKLIRRQIRSPNETKLQRS